jgi:phosphatidylinositol glycan class O
MMKKWTTVLPYLQPLITLLGLYIFSSSFFLAKRSLPRTSTCQDAKSLLRETLGIIVDHDESLDCWMKPSVDKLVVLVVDALRFDFAEHSLPHSFGRRLQRKDAVLMRFVADPPTVTMQRLKGLTTGGLPTFAEISGNLGGGYVEEDSWIDLLWKKGFHLGFVGDDTWVDLFPSQWKEAHPFPSFNTRDLDTVDNGCLQYLPPLLDDLEKGELDVVVAHFLGVDHVGHTYGPHTEFMDQKLRQMDEILDATLSQLESSKSCILTLVFGDHGMTEDGNHGGGTPEEVNAALFVHASDACPTRYGSATELSQIDIVPTVSLAMGIPIPYANLGGLVPSLLPGVMDQNATLALALNAGQVWRYLTEYSANANRLPLKELDILLKDAVAAYKAALAPGGQDVSFAVASSKFKEFLDQATELGKRVWTRFDGSGMLMGGVLIGAMLIFSLFRLVDVSRLTRNRLKVEEGLTLLFAIFTCGVLTFGNSYIEKEQSITVFSLSILCISISTRLSMKRPHTVEPWLPLLLPIVARLHELLITGHGLDISIPLHSANHPLAFLAGITLLGYLRTRLTRHEHKFHVYIDLATLLFLIHSWWEKRQPDTERSGYASCRIALVLWVIGFLYAAYGVLAKRRDKLLVTLKVCIGIMIVTGPPAAASLILFCVQVWVLQQLKKQEVGSWPRRVVIKLLRLLTFVFFTGCAVRSGFLMATRHSTCLLCHQSRLRVQSASPIRSLYRHYRIQLFDGRILSVSQHVWMGIPWFAVGTRMEMVFVLSRIGNGYFVHLSIGHETTPHGVGSLCTSFSLCRNLPRSKLFWTASQSCGNKVITNCITAILFKHP